MTDKEIIINGIDISGCKQINRYRVSPISDIKCYNYGLCKGINCYYKQLKRKEQALDEIESLCKNEACSPCKELEENNHCDECHNKIILDIINKVKEK